MEKFDFIAITETWIQTAGRDFVGEFNIQGYKLFNKDRYTGRVGGMLLYAMDDLDIVKIDAQTQGNTDLLVVELVTQQLKMNIIVVYRPPVQSEENDRHLFEYLDRVVKQVKEGDGKRREPPERESNLKLL